jgi:hypothetical protein
MLAGHASRATDKSFALHSLGTLEALDADIVARQGSAPHDPMQWAALQYHHAMASGEGRLLATDNQRSNEFAPQSVLQFLAAHTAKPS